MDGPLFEAAKLSVSVLRLDAMHPVLSGNKWLKLEPWLKKISGDEQYTGLLTTGGPWSNFLHAAAFACHALGLSFTAVIKAKPGMNTPVTNDIKAWGGHIIYEPKPQPNDNHGLQEMAAKHRQLFIPLGGEGDVGVKGVSDFFSAQNLQGFDAVICPVGTGTTLMGIAFSTMNFQKLVGINPGINANYYSEILQKIQTNCPQKTVDIMNDVSLKRFGNYPDYLLQKMTDWYINYQLPTDIVYTAKMFAVFENLISQQYFTPGYKVLLIHTGGLQGNRSVAKGPLNF